MNDLSRLSIRPRVWVLYHVISKYSIEARRRYQASGKDEKVKKVCVLLGQSAVLSEIN